MLTFKNAFDLLFNITINFLVTETELNATVSRTVPSKVSHTVSAQ